MENSFEIPKCQSKPTFYRHKFKRYSNYIKRCNQGYSAIETTRVLFEIFQRHLTIVRLKKPPRVL